MRRKPSARRQSVSLPCGCPRPGPKRARGGSPRRRSGDRVDARRHSRHRPARADRFRELLDEVPARGCVSDRVPEPRRAASALCTTSFGRVWRRTKTFSCSTSAWFIFPVCQEVRAVWPTRRMRNVSRRRHDRTDTLGQMRRLLTAGYRDPFSFECTAPSVRERRDDLKAPIAGFDCLPATRALKEFAWSRLSSKRLCQTRPEEGKSRDRNRPLR